MTASVLDLTQISRSRHCLTLNISETVRDWPTYVGLFTNGMKQRLARLLVALLEGFISSDLE